MPSLKGLHCSVELGPKRITMKEYQTAYSDGFVQCFIVVPPENQAFSIHLTSSGYIAPGLAMFVFIDGEPQCNRHNINLGMPKGPLIEPKTIDFRVQQKEIHIGGPEYIGREWSFHELKFVDSNESAAANTRKDPNVGKIEVVILRCNGGDPNTRKVSDDSTYEIKAEKQIKMPHSFKGTLKISSSSSKSSEKADEHGKILGQLDGPDDRGPGYNLFPQQTAALPWQKRESKMASRPKPWEQNRGGGFGLGSPFGGQGSQQNGHPGSVKNDNASQRSRPPWTTGDYGSNNWAKPDKPAWSNHGDYQGPKEPSWNKGCDNNSNRQGGNGGINATEINWLGGPPPKSNKAESNNNANWNDGNDNPWSGGNDGNCIVKSVHDWNDGRKPDGGNSWNSPNHASPPQGSNNNGGYDGLNDKVMNDRKSSRGGDNRDNQSRRSSKAPSSKHNSNNGGANNSDNKDNSGNNQNNDNGEDWNKTNNNNDNTGADWNKIDTAGDWNEQNNGGAWANDAAAEDANDKPKKCRSKKDKAKSKVHGSQAGNAPPEASETGNKAYWTIQDAERDQQGLQSPSHTARKLSRMPSEGSIQCTKDFADEQKVSHYVRAGKGYSYYRNSTRPNYIDTMEKPYAVFTFKYRSQEVLEGILGSDAKVRVDKEDFRERMKELSKDEVIEYLMRAKKNLGYATDSSLDSSTDSEGEDDKNSNSS